VPISLLDDGRRQRKCSYTPSPQLENPRRQIGLAADYRLVAHQGVGEGEHHRDGDESPVEALFEGDRT
jgi:hypothetical protein